ncbi:MAG: TIGR04282 family arsenosugar biosynthesis glycosyltransferase [Proteobacteria bacterium]|nr:TIGR04282 family arsenosugar biosynthesis glycosyltransferase [Pseudomonadota bacterium]
MALANSLVVMAKSPEAGRVKTRLIPPLTGVEAAELYTHFIADIFSTLEMVEDIKIYLALLSVGIEEPLRIDIPEGVEVIEQSGSNLGERLYNVTKALFDLGHERVAIIGSDSPDIPPEYVSDAFLRLKPGSSKVVLGPAEDGGYYLIAMNHLDERPFRGINWSTPTVLDETVACLAGEVELLKPWYDIDEPKDILRLKGSKRAANSAAYILDNDIFNRCKDYI